MEPRRIYNHRSTHYQPHRSAASDPGYRSLRAFLLVKRQGAMDHLRKSRPHETHARERSRDRRERSHVPHSTRPISLFRIGQSQAECPLPRVFVLARVGELVAFSTHKIAVREPQFGCASSTLCTASRSRANEVGATTAEPTTQIGDGDGIDNVFPSPIPDPDSIAKTEALSSARKLITVTSLLL